MTREELLRREFIDDIKNWSSDKIYNTFGPLLETVVNQQKDKFQLNLKTIWRNRKWYVFKDTAEQFDNETMLLYFDPKKVKKYSLKELETILEKIEDETIYSNEKLK